VYRHADPISGDRFRQGQYSQAMSMERTDEDLMVAVREGRLDQLEILFGRYRQSLYDFFSRLTGNRVASEDLVQEVFVRILKYRGSYREANKFVTWMYQIARNARADYLRKHRIIPTEVAVNLSGSDHDITTPSRQLEESEERALLECALMRISESNRELLILARYQEMKKDDIAELLGIEPGMVKSRVYRAMKELREVFLKLRSDKSPCSATKSETTLPTL
jgi:RNA polymerase sigma factor (sigma-70 family)